MTDLIVPESARGVRGKVEDPDRFARKSGWSVLGWTGLFVALGSAIDLLLGIFPIELSNADWRYQVATRLPSGLLLPSLGLALGLASLTSLRRHRMARAASLSFAFLAVIVAAGGYYILSISPGILENAGHPAAVELARQAITRTAVQSIVYTGAFSMMAVIGWRYT